MGNRSKRGDHESDAPDPVMEFQEAARWSGYSFSRWPNLGGGKKQGDRVRPPSAAEWIAMTFLSAAVVAALFGTFWLLSKILS